MTLDHETCYRAFRSRDRRFEGRFVVGVTTTGVYCRPGCPARLPRRENVRFLPSTAAAEEEGFRACMRCRPDTSPDSAAWMGTSATIARALRLIDEGALNDGGVEDLAARLGMGERHLRRLFVQRLGAPPRSIARTRRAHFARKLLEETELPIRTVAISAGFGSTRRFNTAMRETFGRPPRDLRRARRAAAKRLAGGNGGTLASYCAACDVAQADGLVLRLPFKPPLDWDSLLGFLAPRAIPGVELVDGETYIRAIRVEGSTGVIAASPIRGENAIRLRVHAQVGPGLDRVARRARRLFDLNADPDRIARDLRKDPLLAPLVRRAPGLRVPGAWDGFETAVRAILGQQVSVRGATTLAGRLVERFGTSLTGSRMAVSPRNISHLFPDPGKLAGADLAGIGLPRTRAEAIRSLARAAVAGEIRFCASMEHEESVRRLCALRGIGPWTAQYIAMRVLGEPDALPSGDLGLQRALKMNAARLEKRSESWRPWRAYAAMHLWRSGSGARAGGGLRRAS